ncbi:transglycosylase domain-containing protein, partial [Clostridioides difficile]|nr:transglycosylase domain-containing protein [Clostridioides difficile]
ALSQVLFGKAPSGLDAREAAIAAALVRAPNATPAKVAERACRILRDMQAEQACAARDGYGQRASARPASAARDDGAALAPHFARRIAAEVRPTAGAQVRTTLD